MPLVVFYSSNVVVSSVVVTRLHTRSRRDWFHQDRHPECHSLALAPTVKKIKVQSTKVLRSLAGQIAFKAS